MANLSVQLANNEEVPGTTHAPKTTFIFLIFTESNKSVTAFEAGLRGVYIWIDTCRVLSPLIPFLVLKDSSRIIPG